MRDLNFRQMTANALSVRCMSSIDVGFYQDIASVAARLDIDSRMMDEHSVDKIKRAWLSLLETLDDSYSDSM